MLGWRSSQSYRPKCLLTSPRAECIQQQKLQIVKMGIISSNFYRSIAVMSSIWNSVPPTLFSPLFGQHGRTSHRGSLCSCLKNNRSLPPSSIPGCGLPPPTTVPRHPLLPGQHAAAILSMTGRCQQKSPSIYGTSGHIPHW